MAIFFGVHLILRKECTAEVYLISFRSFLLFVALFHGGEGKTNENRNTFTPVEIEIFEIIDDSEKSKDLFDSSEPSDIVEDY